MSARRVISLPTRLATREGGRPLKICYVDESGFGSEPIAAMVGVVLDSSRMHVTKAEWSEFLDGLSELAGRQLDELHTSDFYAGNGRFRGIDGAKRAEIVSQVFQWLSKRKHDLVYAAVLKSEFEATRATVPNGAESIWRFLAFHIVLAMQQKGMAEKTPKGHTAFMFDERVDERQTFQELVANPPDWTDSYYERGKKQQRLDQIIDVPSFHDSKLVPMLQVADFVAFFLRRYAEVTDGHSQPRYPEEEEFIGRWISEFKSRSIGRQFIYRSQKRSAVHDEFIHRAPVSIRTL